MKIRFRTWFVAGALLAAFVTAGSLAGEWLSWFGDPANTMLHVSQIPWAHRGRLWSARSCSTPSSPPLVYHRVADNKDYLIVWLHCLRCAHRKSTAIVRVRGQERYHFRQRLLLQHDLSGQCFIYDLKQTQAPRLPRWLSVTTPDYRLDRYHLVNASEDAFYIVGEKKLKTYGLSGIAKVSTGGTTSMASIGG